ncbi:hypothetical protein CRG98_012443 [Punica granatum]|uniref:Uncharacterized protein n=1 Tax=Punica granatum TaxID=22663 RepID=A0A2I0KFB2_PUNGR|nr:hypothetical protein CRG98_012443 [Punica granatum]
MEIRIPPQCGHRQGIALAAARDKRWPSASNQRQRLAPRVPPGASGSVFDVALQSGLNEIGPEPIVMAQRALFVQCNVKSAVHGFESQLQLKEKSSSQYKQVNSLMGRERCIIYACTIRADGRRGNTSMIERKTRVASA